MSLFKRCALLACLFLPMALVQAATRPHAVAGKPPVPLLWEVRGEGDARVLMLGSFHLLKEGDYPLSADVEQAYAQARRVVLELDAREMGSPAVSQQLLRAAIRNDGRRLEQDLTPVQWELLQAWSSQRAMPLASLQTLRPWFVALTINLQSLADAGMRADLGLDMHLIGRAGRDGKPVIGLEEAATQLALLQGIPPQVQSQMLDDALADAKAGGPQVAALHAAWRSGDAGRLWQLAGETMRQRSPALFETMNVQRNQAWLARLPQWLENGQGTTLMVVGSLHLLGEQGLVEQLQTQGRTVRRICTVDGCPKPGRKGHRR